MSTQQQQALEYFRSHATEWRSKANGTDGIAVNIIEQRNQYVLDVAGERSHTETSLDVGCGTGELACQLALRGINASGIDYAPEMISLASTRARDAHIDRATFRCASIFDAQLEPNHYDLISANGFIEYISQRQLVDFFRVAAASLRDGGSLVVGSRNRLFNLMSMNGFTLAESASGDMPALLKEAASWTSAPTLADAVNVESVPVQAPDTTHETTGIDVATRFQYTPMQLISLLKQQGLRATEVYPVHIHGVTPAFAAEHPELHVSIANLLQASARRDTKLLAQASSFMLHATKAA
ncbi:MAG: class I SAM-dependent methyltransferase [bacterium]